jgi:prophage maintenance system killer protein
MERTRVDFLVNFIFESEAIDGIYNDKGILRREINRCSIYGHVGALLILEAKSRNKMYLLNKDTIYVIQSVISARQYSKNSIPEEVSRLVKGINIWQKRCFNRPKKRIIERVADFHFDFEKIHPFANGNGITGRALVYYLLRFAGVEPFVFTNGDTREEYLSSFEKKSAMREYFLMKSEI